MEAGEVPRCWEGCAELDCGLLRGRKDSDVLRACRVLGIVWTCLCIVKIGIAHQWLLLRIAKRSMRDHTWLEEDEGRDKRLEDTRHLGQVQLLTGSGD